MKYRRTVEGRSCDLFPVPELTWQRMLRKTLRQGGRHYCRSRIGYSENKADMKTEHSQVVKISGFVFETLKDGSSPEKLQ
jgi:hypothetical protein